MMALQPFLFGKISEKFFCIEARHTGKLPNRHDPAGSIRYLAQSSPRTPSSRNYFLSFFARFAALRAIIPNYGPSGRELRGEQIPYQLLTRTLRDQ
jgi:hypothetical protein